MDRKLDRRVMREDLLGLVAVLAPLSLVSIGGASSAYAPLQHQTVEVLQWLTPREFLDMFAIARITPGPGSMLATLIGFKVAGLPGALVATLALFAPSSLLCFVIARAWDHYHARPWRQAVEDGLAPIAAGLMFAGVLAMLRLGATGPLWMLSWSIAITVAALLTWRARLHPLGLLCCGAALFVAARAVTG
jgi:chromate transporter